MQKPFSAHTIQETRDILGSAKSAAEYLNIPIWTVYQNSNSNKNNNKNWKRITTTQLKIINDGYESGLDKHLIAENAGCSFATVSKYIELRGHQNATLADNPQTELPGAENQPESENRSGVEDYNSVFEQIEKKVRMKGRCFIYTVCIDNQGGRSVTLEYEGFRKALDESELRSLIAELQAIEKGGFNQA